MLGDSVIRPKEVKDEIAIHNSCLNQRIEDLSNLRNAATGYIADTELKGHAYSNSKEHMRTYYTPLYNGLVYACEEMKSANNRLDNCLGILDGYYEIDEEKTRNLRDESMKRAIEYENEADKLSQQMRNPLINRMQAATLRNGARYAREVAKRCAETLEALYTFKTASSNLYECANEMFGRIEAVEKELKGVEFDSETGTYRLPVGLDPAAEELGIFIQGWLPEYLEKELPNYEHLKELGFTEEEIAVMWELMSDADREFFKRLDGTKEGYTKAFETDPKELTDNMTLVLAMYATKLLKLDECGNATNDDCEQIEIFTNAMLRADINYMYRAEDGSESDSGMKYRDIYLQRLYAGTALLMESSAFTLAMMDKGTPEYELLYNEYRAQCSMTSFWLTQNIVINKLKYHDGWSGGTGDVYLPEISDLKFVDGEVDYILNHRGGYESEHVGTELLRAGDHLRMEWDLEMLKQLQAAKDAVLGNVLLNIVGGVTALLLGALNPALAIMASVMFMLINGSADSITGIDEMVSDKALQLKIRISDGLVKDIINGLIAWQKARDALDTENYKLMMGWFGSGGSYKTSGGILELYGGLSGVSFAGINNPDIIRQMVEWQNNGIKGWSDIDDAEWESRLQVIAENYGGAIYEDCKKLIEGGYDIFGITDYAEFGELIKIIDNARSNYSGSGNSSTIQTQWNSLIGEN